VHVVDLDSGAEQTYRRRYLNVDRARFDSWLLGLACGGAEFRPRTRLVAAEVESDGVTAALARGDRVERVRARTLIGADGARSKVRRRAFPERPGPPAALAIQVRLHGGASLRRHEVLFATRLTSFYAWAIPKGDSVLVGSAFERLDGVWGRFDAIRRLMRDRPGLRGKTVERRTRLISRPRTREDLFAGDARILLAGEASGLISPSSGEGLSFALESGAAAGQALRSPGPASTYARSFRPLARRVARKLAKARVIFSPRLRRVAMLLPWCP
jgi:flavin-dependent dehydrogenase